MSTSRQTCYSHGSSLQFQGIFVNYASRLAHWCQYIEEHCMLHPPFWTPPPGAKFCRFMILPFGSDAPSVSPPNVSSFTSSRSGLVLLDKHGNFSYLLGPPSCFLEFWLQNHVQCPSQTLFKYSKLYVKRCIFHHLFWAQWDKIFLVSNVSSWLGWSPY
jgi:hypothetical protein